MRDSPASRISIPFIALLLVVAWLPRLCAIDRYITPDELTWVYRSVQFREALLDGRWADTLITGHPGVTTTWMGTLGISAQLAFRPADQAIYEWLTHLAWLSPDLIPAFPRLASFLTAGRLAVAILTSLGVVAIYALARPLIGRRAAILAGFFLALDPFTAGLSGLLHVDGLTATLTTLSLLALANGVQKMNSRKAYRYFAAAGALTALAALSKSPALLLGPFSGLILFLRLFLKPAARTEDGGDDQLTNKLMQLIIQVRADARSNKDFATADLIRNSLADAGVVLEDRKDETTWSSG